MVNRYFIQRNKCPLCNSKNINQIFDRTHKEIKTYEFFKFHLNNKFPFKILEYVNFSVDRCSACGLIFQKNIFNKNYSEKFYDKYIDHKKVIKNKKKNDVFKINKKDAFFFQKVLNNKRDVQILEFGSGVGSWAIAMKNEGYIVETIELSKSRRNFLKKKKIKSFKDLKNIKKKYDLIYSDQTFEHLSEPGATIKKLSKLVKKNGYIFFKIPSGHFIENKLNKNYFAQKDEIIPFEHINVFKSKTIKIISKQIKFSQIWTCSLFHIFSFNFYYYLLSDLYQKIFGKKFLIKNDV
jgi:2-polyprenyl-3-methyl-5-hydroxy-6-metoxy-1,4-benzoquinol methylase